MWRRMLKNRLQQVGYGQRFFARTERHIVSLGCGRPSSATRSAAQGSGARIVMEWIEARTILTRTSGYLKTVTSHSLQPYVGCSLGGSLCGVGCYARHNVFLTRGRRWGRFLVGKKNAAEIYRRDVEKEAAWARRCRGEFSVFCSSATEPFPPQERRSGVTRRILNAMLTAPPDVLEFIASKIQTNIRELEGALIRVTGCREAPAEWARRQRIGKINALCRACAGAPTAGRFRAVPAAPRAATP